MNETPDPFIDGLVGKVRNIKPLSPLTLWVLGITALLFGNVYIREAYGMRIEVRDLMLGVWSDKPMVYIKPALFLVVALFALASLAKGFRPEARLTARSLIPPALIILALSVSLGRDWMEFGRDYVFINLLGEARTCFLTVLIGGAAIYAALWAMWLRKAAPSDPQLFGALAGLASASLMATTYALHCRMDTAGYLLLVYGMAIIAVSAAASLSARWLLRW